MYSCEERSEGNHTLGSDSDRASTSVMKVNNYVNSAVSYEDIRGTRVERPFGSLSQPTRGNKMSKLYY